MLIFDILKEGNVAETCLLEFGSVLVPVLCCREQTAAEALAVLSMRDPVSFGVRVLQNFF